MAITLASDSLSDSSLTDGISRGDLTSATRLWVRNWPTAVGAARLYVDRLEVPGLAAEALIGTISMTAMGRGPREDVASFVTAAVRELGEDEDAPASQSGEILEVYPSPRMTRTFEALPTSAQQVLREVAEGRPSDEHAEHALTVLQTDFLRSHLAEAPTPECRSSHLAMSEAAERSATGGFPASNWPHLSTCAWCTEAFHEIAFSNTALSALITPAAFAAVSPIVAPTTLSEPVAEPEPAAAATVVGLEAVTGAEGAGAVETAEGAEAAESTSHRAGAPALLRGGRNRLLGAAGVTAAAAVLALILTQTLSGGDDATEPSAANGALPTPSALATDGLDGFDATPTAPATPATPRTPSEKPSATEAAPLVLPTPAPTSTSPSPSLSEAAPKPAPKPTKKPTPKTTPSPTSPTTSSPPEPTPTPTPSPTPTCNDFQHFLGIC